MNKGRHQTSPKILGASWILFHFFYPTMMCISASVPSCDFRRSLNVPQLHDAVLSCHDNLLCFLIYNCLACSYRSPSHPSPSAPACLPSIPPSLFTSQVACTVLPTMWWPAPMMFCCPWVIYLSVWSFWKLHHVTRYIISLSVSLSPSVHLCWI